MAYLVNRYPETSLTTVRREISAVVGCGVEVLRFAHRPSMQPLAGTSDQAEAELTEYLATGSLFGLVSSLAGVFISHPRGVSKALGQLLGLKPLKMRNLSYLLLASRLVERMKAGGAEHLHVHFAQSSAIVAMLARSIGGPQWSMTVHGPEDLVPENHRVLSMLVLNASATVAISEWAAESIRRIVLPSIGRMRVIGMGVDCEFLDPPVPIDPYGEIICVARLDQRKGHAVLLEALDLLRMRGLTPNVKFIGDGPCRDQLTSDVRRRGLQRQVQFAGWLTESEVKESIDRCRFMVLPSYSEGLPVSIMEAFARARPVIASEVAGIPELIHENDNGLLIPPGNADALATSMQTFLETPVTRLLELGMKGRAEVMNRFRSARNGQLLVEFWRECSP